MHDFIYQDASCDLTNCERYNLSIQLALDGFSLLIQNPEDQAILLLDHTPLQLSGVSGMMRKSGELLAAKNLSGNKFNNVVVFPESRLSKLVPLMIQPGNYLKNLFNLSSRELKSLSFVSYDLDDRYKSVFGCHTDIFDMYTSLFPGCLFKHETVPLINRNRKDISDDETILKCHFHTGYFFVTAFKGKEIRLFNNYTYTTPEDVLYYLTAVASVVEAPALHLELSGNIMLDNPVFTLLKQHFGMIRFISFENREAFKGKPGDFDMHTVSPLLSYAGL